MPDLRKMLLAVTLLWCGGFLIGLTLGSMIEKTPTEICIEAIK